MTKGTVKWFDTIKGYGFIQPDDGSEDIFVHISEVVKAGYTNLNNNQAIRSGQLHEMYNRKIFYHK
jgi:CspA family cold shock protein